jgi:carbamoyltransferase
LLSDHASRHAEEAWIRRAVDDHKHWHDELDKGLRRFGWQDKLARHDHHLSHAANAYLPSGFERALIVTIDGYGSGLAGSIGLGESGRIKRLSELRFPNSLGTLYETVTGSLGFRPDRHAGKIVGLAAYGDPGVLADVLMSRVRFEDGTFRLADNLNVYLSRHLASEFPMIDVAAAYQHVLERVAARWVRHWVERTGCGAIVLSGGVTANVKLNQRLFEVPGVERIFVYPNMGDGGCGTGVALYDSWGARPPEAVHDVYLGPDYGDADIRAELEREGLAFRQPENLARTVAEAIAGDKVVARFGGRMEYGPRALGNRSILYHGRDPQVNQWLNQRLGRTEFMPFAPVTLWEARERCYHGVAGAEHAAEFMTITFDCTDFMRRHCPAAVHVDNTARPQLIRRDKNPEYYDILAEHEKLSGSPSIINTSFNMHEEPIVCSPRDAVRAFLDGRLDCLAIGPYFVEAPTR